MICGGVLSNAFCRNFAIKAFGSSILGLLLLSQLHSVAAAGTDPAGEVAVTTADSVFVIWITGGRGVTDAAFVVAVPPLVI